MKIALSAIIVTLALFCLPYRATADTVYTIRFAYSHCDFTQATYDQSYSLRVRTLQRQVAMLPFSSATWSADGKIATFTMTFSPIPNEQTHQIGINIVTASDQNGTMVILDSGNLVPSLQDIWAQKPMHVWDGCPGLIKVELPTATPSPTATPTLVATSPTATPTPSITPVVLPTDTGEVAASHNVFLPAIFDSEILTIVLPTATAQPVPTATVQPIGADIIAIRPDDPRAPYGMAIIDDTWVTPEENTNVASAYFVKYAMPSGSGFSHGMSTTAVVHNYDNASASADLVNWKNRIASQDGCFESVIQKRADESYGVTCRWNSNDWDWQTDYYFARSGHVRMMAMYWQSAKRAGMTVPQRYVELMLTDNGFSLGN